MDRYADKYKSHSPYNYVLNNPIKSIDANGDTVVVLHAPEGAHGFGHMAILIQNEDRTYSLYSKNGTNESSGLSGPNDKGNDVQVGSFKTAKEFMDSKFNPIIDKKTGAREYSEVYIIPSKTSDDVQAVVNAKEEMAKPYDLLKSSCATMVQVALQGIGKKDGKPSTAQSLTAEVLGALFGPTIKDEMKTTDKKTPNIIYQNIKKQNDGTVIKP